MKNNRGFSLIEVVVAIAVSSFVVFGITVITVTSQRAYTSLYNTANLQFNSQVAMSQLENRLVNCNAGIVYIENSNTFCVVNVDKLDNIVLYTYKIDGNTLYYSQMQGASNLPVENYASFINTPAKDGDIMSQNIVSLEIITDKTHKNINDITILATFENSQKSLPVNLNIALENKPYFTHDIADLLEYLQME